MEKASGKLAGLKLKHNNMNKSYFCKNKVGFTIIEMVTVVALIGLLSMIVSVFVSQSLKAYRLKRQSMDLEEKAAHVMREFEQNVRAASSIETADETELVFYRYYDAKSQSPTKVRYFLDGNRFKIGLTQPSGIAPNIIYPSENETIHLIVENVVNLNVIFQYFDSASNLLNEPVDIANVKMVELTISLDQDINSPPSAITETTKINLRNMKDNL